MAELGEVTWPVTLVADDMILRATQASDRAAYIELLCSSQVRRYLGGPHDRAGLEAAVGVVPGAYAGVFAVEHSGSFVGMVTLDRRDAARPGHVVVPDGLEPEISYTFLPEWWGRGIASVAVGGVLDWASQSLLDAQVLLCTQVANTRSMALAKRLGFKEAQRFEEFGELQWLGVRSL